MITDMAQEMASLVEIKRRLAAIEQGQLTAANLLDALHTEQEEISTSQQILCERLDRILARMEEPLNISGVDREVLLESMAREKRMEQKLDCLQGKELLSQFKAKPKRRKR